MRKISLSVAMAALLLTGCMGTNQEMGTVLGAGLGGLGGYVVGNTIGGNDVLLTAGGVLLGAWIGNQVGAGMDQADRNAAAIAQQQAFESAPDGQATQWRNPNTGHSGQVIPTSTYQRTDGRYCREFTHNVVVAGERQQAYGTACRAPDGTWQIVQ